ncbi:MAG: hypothetical protein A2V88_16780 [Elusimicrobia bacterium RBG_16_66_12]|nr:MAG: hypothetical protein A2V88_16780 [Elusimicrobia bacterium RBG_16_66_12]
MKSTAKAMTPGMMKNSRPTASSAATATSIFPAFWPRRSGYMMVPHPADWAISAAPINIFKTFAHCSIIMPPPR